MYTHSIQLNPVTGTYRLTISIKGIGLYEQEYRTERAARNGLITFMYTGGSTPESRLTEQAIIRRGTRAVGRTASNA